MTSVRLYILASICFFLCLPYLSKQVYQHGYQDGVDHWYHKHLTCVTRQEGDAGWTMCTLPNCEGCDPECAR